MTTQATRRNPDRRREQHATTLRRKHPPTCPVCGERMSIKHGCLCVSLMTEEELRRDYRWRFRVLDD